MVTISIKNVNFISEKDRNILRSDKFSSQSKISLEWDSQIPHLFPALYSNIPTYHNTGCPPVCFGGPQQEDYGGDNAHYQRIGEVSVQPQFGEIAT